MDLTDTDKKIEESTPVVNDPVMIAWHIKCVCDLEYWKSHSKTCLARLEKLRKVEVKH